MHSKLSSDWLPSYIMASRPVPEIFKMEGYFLDRPCTHAWASCAESVCLLFTFNTTARRLWLYLVDVPFFLPKITRSITIWSVTNASRETYLEELDGILFKTGEWGIEISYLLYVFIVYVCVCVWGGVWCVCGCVCVMCVVCVYVREQWEDLAHWLVYFWSWKQNICHRHKFATVHFM